MQIEGTELTESGQRARSNRNFRLGPIYTVRHAAGNDRCLRKETSMRWRVST